MVSNCGKNEYGGVTGGQAGDQTQQEFWNISWYNFGQTVVYRYPNDKVASLLAEIAKYSAENNHIGYDQPTRLSFYQQLKGVNWHPEKITINCAADCSSATAAIVIACGHQLQDSDDKNLRKIGERFVEFMNPSDTTWTIGEDLANCGFQAMRDSKYLSSDAYLKKGDINLNDTAHVNINITNGFKIEEDAPEPTEPAKPIEYGYTTLQYGDGLRNPRKDVKAMQTLLQMQGYTLQSDGEFGAISKATLLKFQLSRKITPDGICGEESWKELIKVEK